MTGIEIKSIFDKAGSYREFYSDSNEKNQTLMTTILGSKDLSDKTVLLLKKIDYDVNILVIGENWCPDCIINITALEVMKNINDHINYKIIEKDGLENEFKEYHYDFKLKMPTIFVLKDDFFIKDAFIEVPKLIRSLEKSDDQVKRIKTMKEYRKGNFIENTILEIIEIICS